MVNGAKEHRMPDFYISELEKIAHNGYEGKVEIDLPLHVTQ